MINANDPFPNQYNFQEGKAKKMKGSISVID